MLAVALFVVALVGQASAGMPQQSAGALEGRPSAADASPLQARVDAAPAGAVVEVDAGVYVGDLILERPIRLVGRGRPRLVGSGHGSVIRVRADEVVIEGFDIDGRDGGDLGRDSSGIHVAAKRVTVRDCRIVHALFGVYLRSANGATVENVTIEGVAGRPAGEQGSGIHVFDTTGFRLIDNRVSHMRDGMYIQASPGGVIAHNRIGDLRYALHYMFSDDNTFEDNVFERSDAGAAVMFSNRISFRRNRFLHNRGYASVGLLLQSCDQVTAEDNVIADNARGLFLEGDRHGIFRGNLIAESDIALVIFDSAKENRFEGNTFVGNLSPLQLVGRRTDTIFDRNYWSDATEPDLDGDGVRDRPYRLSSVFDHLRGNLTAADLFAQGLAADVLAQAERAFPVLDPIPVVDAHPLASRPARAELDGADALAQPNWLGLAVSAVGVCAGWWCLWPPHVRRWMKWRPA